MPRLVINGTAHELVGDLITIGRGPDNSIVIADSSVSTHHAQLELVGENYRLKDLGSTNGTRVNGIGVVETMLQVNDVIRFGVTEARYQADPIGSQPPPQIQKVEARPANSSASPGGFANPLAFLHQKHQKDTVRTAIFASLAVILLIFLGSMIAVLLMHAPAP